MNEFELIEHHFRQRAVVRDDVLLGIGDDAALLRLPVGAYPVCVQATLAPAQAPDAFAGALLARALARLAADAAEARWATLALTLPAEDPRWLDRFANALADQLSARDIALVGGDTTRGPAMATLGLLGHRERPRSPAPAAAGDRLLLADAADRTGERRLLEFSLRLPAIACDGDVRAAADTLAAAHGLCARWDTAPPAILADSALLLALPADESPPLAGWLRLGRLHGTAGA